MGGVVRKYVILSNTQAVKTGFQSCDLHQKQNTDTHNQNTGWVTGPGLWNTWFQNGLGFFLLIEHLDWGEGGNGMAFPCCGQGWKYFRQGQSLKYIQEVKDLAQSAGRNTAVGWGEVHGTLEEFQPLSPAPQFSWYKAIDPGGSRSFPPY
jgi:hypothetical protein